jgi:CheY-like chemotaxis protein
MNLDLFPLPYPSTPVAFFRDPSFLPGDHSTKKSHTEQDKPHASRILVIDDEILIADSLTEILAAHGYEATPCYDGSSAIECARIRCPDFIVSDVIMPKISGIDAVLAIKALCPNTRILLFSGQAGTADLLEDARARDTFLS